MIIDIDNLMCQPPPSSTPTIPLELEVTLPEMSPSKERMWTSSRRLIKLLSERAYSPSML